MRDSVSAATDVARRARDYRATTCRMRWIVGTDLGERSAGALRMAAWLRDHAVAGKEHELFGVHVIDERLRTMAPEGHAQRIIDGAGQALQRAVDSLGIARSFSELHATLAASPEAGLTAAATTLGVDGAIIGRFAGTYDATLWRLGRVARRLLRELPAPIMVVPPDLASTEIGAGPIVLATDLGDDSIAAGRLARRLATDLDRPLLVVHVDPALTLGASVLGFGIPMPEEMHPRCVADVERWIEARELGPAVARLLEGDAVDQLLRCARDEQAPLIVCGSRRLGLAERIFSSSVGVDLARHAERAVLVVPPSLPAPDGR